MYSAVIVAAGKGIRSQLSFNKIFYRFQDKSLIDFTIQPFEKDKDCDKIVLVISEDDQKEMKEKVFSSKVVLVLGGKTRQESVLAGLKQVSSPIVMIHDGARPNLHPLFIEKCKEEVIKHRATTLGIEIKDTLKRVKNHLLGDTVPRENTIQLQTPQVFYTADILKAHQMALTNLDVFTDDASLYQKEIQKEVYVIPGDEYNIKATTKIDLMVLEEILCTK